MLDIYDKKGFLDFDKIISLSKQKNTPFIFIVGARGIGKTYGSLLYSYANNMKFMYIRRLKTQADICRTAKGQPFNKINSDNHLHVGVNTINKEVSGFYNQEYESENGWICKGEPVGYLSALSTFANLNSADFSDVDLLIYDEFIPKPNEAKIRDEAGSFFGFYETIARNRELLGNDPMISICCANSNNLANPLFIELQIVDILLENRKKGNDYFCDYKRGFIVIDISNSPISKQKEDTALYRLTQGTQFREMALYNDFVEVDDNNIKYERLNEYLPLCVVGEIAIYRHKSKNQFYVSKQKNAIFNQTYATGKADLKSFTVNIGWSLRSQYLMYHNVLFESYLCKALFETYVLQV